MSLTGEGQNNGRNFFGNYAVFSKKTKKRIIAIGSSIGSFLILYVLIPSLVVSAVADKLNIVSYEQECPELVRAFLAENYDKFENEVRSLCSDEDFMSFVTTIEFDNAYTKLVYGGTNSYTQEELKGNYVGVQEQSAEWVSKVDVGTQGGNENSYYVAKSVLEVIDEYKDRGLSDSDITIRDEYLEGYGNASGIKEDDETLTFDKWVKNSYYLIPYYYHWSSAKSAGSDNSYFSWRNNPCLYWPFTYQKPYYGLFYEDMNVGKNSYNGRYLEMSYRDYLNMGLTSKKSSTFNKRAAPYIAQEVPLGYKMEWDSESGYFTKVLKKLKGRDTSVDYTIFTLTNKKMTDSDWDGVASISDDLYIQQWFKDERNNKSNYDKYLKKVSTSEAVQYGQREGIINSNVAKWQDNFAEYFAKEIYYTYPNRDYIVDYFLSKSVSRDKKVAFLQRSFYSMATGASLDVELDESYSVSNGIIINDITEKQVGTLGIKSYSIEKMEPVNISYKLANKMTQTHKIEKISDYQEIEECYKKWINEEESTTEFFEVYYAADIKYMFNNGSVKTLKKVPITYCITKNDGSFESKVIVNDILGKKPYSTINRNKIIKKINIEWDEIFYNSQYQTNGFDGTDRDVDKSSNPLDNVKPKSKSWYFEVNAGSTNNFDINLFKSQNIINILAETAETNNEDRMLQVFDGQLLGGRIIELEYNDHSFLTYHVSEQKDSFGKLESVNIEIYTYYPDVSVYNEGQYRVAYGFETPGAITEAFSLLQYVEENNTLNGVKEVVDFEQLFIPLDEEWAKNGYLTESSDLETFIADMIISVESGGNWSDAHNATYGREVTITVGIVQWYGGRAHKLLKKLCKKNSKEAKEKLGADLYNECIKTCSGACVWETSHRYFNETTELPAIREVLGTEWGREVQEEQFKNDVAGYIDIAHKMGLSDDKLVAYFCELYHQTPVSARAVVTRLINYYGSVTRVNTEAGALDKMYEISMEKSVGRFYQYESRHKKCYEKCKNLTNVIEQFYAKSSEKTKKAIQFAISKIGCPYSQTKRNGTTIFDCSNLIYAAWKHAGVDISNGAGSGANTESELKWCEKNAKLICSTVFDESKLKIGDLIFFATNPSHYRNVGHISMYVGNGQVVEAGDPVGVYDISSWHTENFMEAYRITDK